MLRDGIFERWVNALMLLSFAVCQQPVTYFA
jgi:hypothetical protein